MILKATAFFHAFHKHPEGLEAAKTKVIRSVIQLIDFNFSLVFCTYGNVKSVNVPVTGYLLTARYTDYIKRASIIFYILLT